MKKKLVKAVSVAMALTMTAGLATGCNSSSGSGSKSSKKSTSGSSEGSVYWLNFKPEADEALQEIAKTYKEETGVSVKVVTAASGSYEETLTAEMDKSDAPTLFVVGNDASVATWGSSCVDLKNTDVYNELSTDDYTL